MFRYRLRTLLIVLALGPAVIWAGWLVRESLRPKRNPWYIYDGADIQWVAPGPEFKLERKARRIILTGDDPDESRAISEQVHFIDHDPRLPACTIGELPVNTLKIPLNLEPRS